MNNAANQKPAFEEMMLDGEQINYQGILWPLPYRAGALDRASSLRRYSAELADLYERIFSLESLRLSPIDVALPYSAQMDDQDSANQYFAHDPDLPLSIVTVTRNDDHVERMAERTQAFIDCLYCLAEKYQRRIELIIVEWNPPQERHELAHAFQFPREHAFVSTSIVTVPREIHQKFNLAGQLPLYQMIGKNVGIRRARGEFILATNIDVLLSESLFELISAPGLEKGKIYRGNRWDVDRRILDLDSPAAMLEQAADLTFQINYPHATVPVDADIPEEIPLMDYLGHRILPKVHTMACGDFQLMHREDWARVRGYTELDTFSFHLDSLFAVTCHFAGIDEVDMGNAHPHFHIDHTLGTSIKSDSYVIESSKVMKHLSLGGLLNLSRNMEVKGDYFIYNKANWGMAGLDLPTTHLTRAEWETGYYQPQPLCPDTSPGAQDGFNLCSVNVDDQQLEQQRELLQDICADIAKFLKGKGEQRKLLIWGTGHRARVFNHYLSTFGVEIHGFVDSDGTSNRQLESDMMVTATEQLKDSQNYFLLIFSMYADDIRHQLEAMNLTEGRDYIVGF